MNRPSVVRVVRLAHERSRAPEVPIVPTSRRNRSKETVGVIRVGRIVDDLPRAHALGVPIVPNAVH